MRSAIDVGTNTVLLLVAEKGAGQTLQVVYEDQRVPRLGKGVDKHRNLHPESIDRVIEAIKNYQDILTSRFPEVPTPVVTATSAVRDARNRDVFTDRVFEETGLKVQVLSGEREAEYTFGGALSMLPEVSGPVAVLDIGGGSTEISVGEGYILHDRFSYNMGCVRYTERYLSDDPVSDQNVEWCRDAIREELDYRPFNISEAATLVGVAGTVTSLAYMEYCQSGTYDAVKLNGTQLTLEQIAKWIEKIKTQPSFHLLQQYPEVMEGRADIFLAGLLILEECMVRYKFDKLQVSVGGIRYGALLRHETRK